MEEWLELCGVLFRFPSEDTDDLYCNDDYDGYLSFKSWLKRKYCGKDLNLCIRDTYVDNQRQVKEFREARKNRDFLQARRTDQLERSVDLGGECNSLRESLCVKDVFLEPNAEWKYSVWENATTAEIEMLSEDDAELLRCFAELKKLRSEFEYVRDSLGEVA